MGCCCGGKSTKDKSDIISQDIVVKGAPIPMHTPTSKENSEKEWRPEMEHEFDEFLKFKEFQKEHLHKYMQFQQ